VRGHVCDHVVEVRQELRVEERQDPLVELARTPRGHHIVIARVVRRRVLIVTSIVDGETMSAKIVEAVGAVTAAGILKLARRCVHQCGLDALGLMVPDASRCRRGSLLRVVRTIVLERAGLVVRDALVMILVAILVRLMRVIGVVRGNAGCEARRCRPIVVLIVVAVLVVAFVRFREVGGRGGGRCARTRGVLWQASDGSVSPSVSYVRFLNFLHWLILRRRVGILAVWILGRHVQHQIDGFIIESGRFGAFRQSIELLPLLGRLGI